MEFLRRHIRIVFTLALFLMAAGQALHACADARCDSAQEQSSCPDEQDCPIGDCCHVGTQAAMIEQGAFHFMPSAFSLLALKSEITGDGPCREIDYPPQLS